MPRQWKTREGTVPLTEEDMTKVTGKKGGHRLRKLSSFTNRGEGPPSVSGKRQTEGIGPSHRVWYSWAEASNKACEHEDEIVTPPTVWHPCACVYTFGAGLGGELGRVRDFCQLHGGDGRGGRTKAAGFDYCIRAFSIALTTLARNAPEGTVLCASDPPQVWYLDE